MAWRDATAFVTERFATEWGGETPIAETNAEFDPDDLLDAGAAYVQLDVLWASARVASVADRPKYRDSGDVVIQVFTPEGNGRGRNIELAERAASIFRGLEQRGFRFWAPRMIHVGNRRGWYQQNVLCPFEHDHRFDP